MPNNFNFNCNQFKKVSRLLLSEPHYHSSFEYITQSLELNQTREVVNLENPNQQIEATSQTLMDFYSTRNSNPVLAPIINTIQSFNSFVQKYKVTKGKLIVRPNSEKIIVVTHPKVTYSPKIIETYQHYCYYQLIKFSPWSIDNLEQLKDKTTAIERFENFLTTTSPEILENIRFEQ
jgi:hypothetical protein